MHWVQLIDRAVLVGRITLDNLVIVHDMFIKVALNQLVEALQLHCSCLQTHVFVYME